MIGDKVKAVMGSDHLGPCRSRGGLWIVFSVRWALGEDSSRGEAGPVWLSRAEVRVVTQARADGDWAQFEWAEVSGFMKYSEGRLVWLWHLTGCGGGAEVSKEEEPRITWTLGGRRCSRNDNNHISRVACPIYFPSCNPRNLL